MLGDFFREKDAVAVATFASNLVDALFQGVPESASSKEVPAKTKVPQPVLRAHQSLPSRAPRTLHPQQYLQRAASVEPTVQCAHANGAVFQAGRAIFCRGAKAFTLLLPSVQVGLVVTAALVLRSVPEALLPLAPALLKAGRSLTGSGRLPLLLWLLLQATKRDPATPLACRFRRLSAKSRGRALTQPST